MRVTDAMVEGFLLWARNYREIESFEKIEGGGRCWKITLRAPVWAFGDEPMAVLSQPERMVPDEFVLTAREALAFGYGVAVGGASERRADFAAREWQWGEAEKRDGAAVDDPPALPAPATVITNRRDMDRLADTTEESR